jgi:hypothetical protein
MVRIYLRVTNLRRVQPSVRLDNFEIGAAPILISGRAKLFCVLCVLSNYNVGGQVLDEVS